MLSSTLLKISANLHKERRSALRPTRFMASFAFGLLAVLLTVFLPVTKAHAAKTDFVRVENGHFMLAGKPYYFIGTNFWYGPILASKGKGGDRKRLRMELDRLKSLGLTNLRILVGAEAGSRNVTSLSPYLLRDGHLNDTLLDGLDYLLREMERRKMRGVFYLTNSWDWSGGFGYYLKRAGKGDSPDASGEGYNDYVRYAAQFYADSIAMGEYLNHVRQIVTRRNRYTHRLYKDEPAIMAWQLCNEPRPFDSAMFEPMLAWSAETARLIRSLDPNHLISTGSEGTLGCIWNKEVCRRMHADENIDYLTVHVWPVNWGWASRDRLRESLPNVFLQTREYLSDNLRIAAEIDKPVVIEEFGYSRDRNFLSPGTPTESRNQFYAYVFSQVLQSAQEQGLLAGCNFWGWGGLGQPRGQGWQAGDDYVCDPPHEPQGWYSVFAADEATLQLIQCHTDSLSRIMH